MCLFHPIQVFIHYCHVVIVLNDYLVHSCWGLHVGSQFKKLEALGALMAPLSFFIWIAAELLCSCPCLLHAIVKLHAMDENYH